MGAVAIFGAGVFINDTDSTPEVATQTGGGGGQGGGGRFGGGGGDDYNDKWYFEDPESDANNFFIRGGVQGIRWIIACPAASARVCAASEKNSASGRQAQQKTCGGAPWQDGAEASKRTASRLRHSQTLTVW